MTKPSGPIVFFGNERLATAVNTDTLVLKALVNEGYNVAFVVSGHENSQSRKTREHEIETTASKFNIPLLLPKKLSEISGKLSKLKPVAGVLVAYGKIVPSSVIDIFPAGIINIHPSLLPLHRGPTPIESAMLNGDTKTGVSLMKLAKEMDAGPVYAQSELKLSGTETKQQLADNLLEMGKNMLVELLPGILNGSVVALPQDNSRATYDSLIDKKDGEIDWKKPAVQIEREIRAYCDWPGSRTLIGSKEVIITKARVVSDSGTPGKVQVKDKNLVIYTGKGALLIDCLKPAGKREMTAKAFLAGNSSFI